MIIKNFFFISSGILAVAIIRVNTFGKSCKANSDCGDHGICTEIKYCSNKACTCEEGYRRINNEICVKHKKHGEVCISDEDVCEGDTHCPHHGREDVCQCYKGHVYRDGKCVFSDKCSNNTQCTDSEDKCKNGRCVCNEGYERFGEVCFSEEEIKDRKLDEGEVCNNKKPYCKPGTECVMCPDDEKRVCMGSMAAGQNPTLNIFILVVLTVMKNFF